MMRRLAKEERLLTRSKVCMLGGWARSVVLAKCMPSQASSSGTSEELARARHLDCNTNFMLIPITLAILQFYSSIVAMFVPI